MDGARADSAGIPFEGRRFHDAPASSDDGSAPEKLVEAIRRLRAGELSIADVVAVLHHERLLVPLVAEAGDEGIGPYGQKVDKTQELSIVTVAGPDGRPALPAFSSVAAMQEWKRDARPIPIEAPRVALAAASEQAALIVLDPGSDTQTIVRAPAFRALATGEPWTPAYDDPEVARAVVAALEGEPLVEAVGVAPGDATGRTAVPELVVVLRFAADSTEHGRQAVVARANERWRADEVIASRVDSIAVRVAG